MTLPVLLAQASAAAAAVPVEYVAPIGLAVGAAALISAAWRVRTWVRRQAHEVVGAAMGAKAFDKHVYEVLADALKSDEFKDAIGRVVAEAFTGREEADRHFRRETLENQREAITAAVDRLAERIETRVREVETKQESRARETDALTTKLLVQVEFAIRDAKNYMARVAGEYQAMRKLLEEPRAAGAAANKERGA